MAQNPLSSLFYRRADFKRSKEHVQHYKHSAFGKAAEQRHAQGRKSGSQKQ